MKVAKKGLNGVRFALAALLVVLSFGYGEAEVLAGNDGSGVSCEWYDTDADADGNYQSYYTCCDEDGCTLVQWYECDICGSCKPQMD